MARKRAAVRVMKVKSKVRPNWEVLMRVDRRASTP